jgi:hypothetical protein
MKLVANWEITSPILIQLTKSDITSKQDTAFAVFQQIISLSSSSRVPYELKQVVADYSNFAFGTAQWQSVRREKFESALMAGPVETAARAEIVRQADQICYQSTAERAVSAWSGFISSPVWRQTQSQDETKARIQTIRVLGLLGDQGTIPLLQRINSSDSQASVRDEANKAIAIIKTRTTNTSQ